eukprot:5286091-Alexandrium_andersonii.AAC.1
MGRSGGIVWGRGGPPARVCTSCARAAAVSRGSVTSISTSVELSMRAYLLALGRESGTAAA